MNQPNVNDPYPDYQSPSNTTSPSLMADCVADKSVAWSKLNLVWGSALFGYFRGKPGVNRESAEDLTQEVLAKVTFSIRSGYFQRDGKRLRLRNFVFFVANNCLKNYYRDYLSKPSSPGGSDYALIFSEIESMNESDLDEDFKTFEAIAVIEQLKFIKEKVTSATYETFYLHYYEGKEYDQICAIQGIAPGTARRRVHRIREMLKRELDGILDLSENNDSAG